MVRGEENMVYLWEFPRNYPKKMIGLYDHDHSPNYLLFSEGKKLEKNELRGFDDPAIFEHPVINFEVPKEKLISYDCIRNNASIPLVNERLKSFLEKLAPNDVQFFEAKLHCTDGDLEGYYFLNVTHEIKGIDFEKSDYEKIDMPRNTFRYDFNYMVYKPNCMDDYKFAREKDYHGNLIISKDMAHAIEKGHFKGIYLVRPEDFYHPITAQDLINAENAE